MDNFCFYYFPYWATALKILCLLIYDWVLAKFWFVDKKMILFEMKKNIHIYYKYKVSIEYSVARKKLWSNWGRKLTATKHSREKKRVIPQIIKEAHRVALRPSRWHSEPRLTRNHPSWLRNIVQPEEIQACSSVLEKPTKLVPKRRGK